MPKPNDPAAAAAAKAQALVDAQNKPQTAPASGATAPPAQQTAQTSPQTPAPIAAGGQRTRDGAVITFANTSGHAAAVFERGATVWVVLDGAPPIDPMKLRAALGDFPASVDASSANGTSVLRIVLKKPESVAATTMAGNLKVTIAPQIAAAPIAIGFVRNDDPHGPYITTLVPGALRAITLDDPAVRRHTDDHSGHTGTRRHRPAQLSRFRRASDRRGACDRAALRRSGRGGRSIAHQDFAPGGIGAERFVGSDALFAVATVAPRRRADLHRFHKVESGARQGISRCRTPPAPESHAAKAAGGQPCASGSGPGSILPINMAREALGLIDLIQATDPTLQGDAQLQTMRGAADYMMGRYRDAHNDLSASAFDNDPHAAFWRGLIDGELGDQASARTALTQADPVISHYPSDWQVRAHIAKANAALAAGSLESADAALSRVPHDLPKPLLLDSELARANLYARENRMRDSFALFDAVEKSDDERAAAHAIFDHVTAGLAAKKMPPAIAIDMLEKLRYRWRGDALELQTLRKLGSLYFSTQHWREGLQTLRVASDNFPEDELARQAQDDMRAAFVSLFLKGGADKMSPVQALALFYDFIELTPIGSDGDEMIRRMSDRLMAVDLLEPAAKLLDYQVNKRLDGVAQSQVAGRLAMIYLMDHKPKDALEALRNTRIAGLPDDINHQRMILESRALAALKQWDSALDTIAVDEAPDTQRLRADIYWGKRQLGRRGAESRRIARRELGRRRAARRCRPPGSPCAPPLPIRWRMMRPVSTGCALISRPR